MHRRSFSTAFGLALLALALGCSSTGSSPSGVAVVSPANSEGFPAHAQVDIVLAEASFFTNHEQLFGEDLIDEDGIIPIALRVGMRGEGQDVSQIALAPQDMDLRLYLQDGTALRSIPSEQVAEGRSSKVADRVIALSLKKSGWLAKWDQTQPGFVFFQAQPRSAFDFDGTQVVHSAGKIERVLDLSRSLVAFNVTMKDELEPFFVGVTRQVKAGLGK